MNNRIFFFLTVIVIFSSVMFSQKKSESVYYKPSVTKEKFGTTPDGKQVDLYTLTNAHGLKASIMTYGGILVSLSVPDTSGKFGDVVLGFDSLSGYLEGHPYFGAIVGRYANSIAKGRFTLDGVEYHLAQNNGENHLHGGIKGFDKVVWDAEPVRSDGWVGLLLTYESKHEEEGYPGNLSCTVVYMLIDNNELKINYEATTDHPTIVNLTHHSYFNLAGQGNGDILNHELWLNADKFTPVDSTLIPTGELKNVNGTPFDFREATTIGKRIAQTEGGYDHNFVLNKTLVSPSLAARVYEPTSGRVMEVYTTEPGMQFYTGNFLDGSLTGKAGKVYQKHFGFCLEAQYFPDSPNKPNFPSATLRRGEKYTQSTSYKFSVRK